MSKKMQEYFRLGLGIPPNKSGHSRRRKGSQERRKESRGDIGVAAQIRDPEAVRKVMKNKSPRLTRIGQARVQHHLNMGFNRKQRNFWKEIFPEASKSS